jgi:hypothetical protein
VLLAQAPADRQRLVAHGPWGKAFRGAVAAVSSITVVYRLRAFFGRTLSRFRCRERLRYALGERPEPVQLNFFDLDTCCLEPMCPKHGLQRCSIQRSVLCFLTVTRFLVLPENGNDGMQRSVFVLTMARDRQAAADLPLWRAV